MEAEGFLQFIQPWLAGTEIYRLVEEVASHLRSGSSLTQYLELRGMKQGVSGYINHTVSACLFCWLAYPQDFRTAVEQIIVAGGDADSTGATVGALGGLTLGSAAIPVDWTSNLMDWPRNLKWIERLADALAADRLSPAKSHRAIALFWPGALLRNVFFLGVVLVHGLRRSLPPY